MFGMGSDKPAGGMEMLLRSMGGGQVLDAINKLVEDGTIDKIVQFTEQMDKQNAILEEVRDELRALRGSVQFLGANENDGQETLRQSAGNVGAGSDPRADGGPIAIPGPSDATPSSPGAD